MEHGYRYVTVLTTMFLAPSHGRTACTLDFVVYVEKLPDTSDWYTYPVNTMRNLALDMVKTEVSEGHRITCCCQGNKSRFRRGVPALHLRLWVLADALWAGRAVVSRRQLPRAVLRESRCR